MAEAEPGHRIGGRYHLLEPIGRGGMGIVWRAHDDLLDRAVAVKEVRYNGAFGDELAELNRRTLREARAAGRLNHPNVVVVHDVIEEDGRPWIVMQLVSSRSLGQVIREDGPLAPERAAEIGLEVLKALRSAHGQGVLHRDVKPENVLLADDGRVVLTDFGIARVETDNTMTRTGLVGTPAFIPPERLRGSPAQRESDLWSLGATLYAAVEGKPPHDKGSPLPTMHAVLMDEPEPAVHAGRLGVLIDGLLRKDPAERPSYDEAERMLRRSMRVEPPPPSDERTEPHLRRPVVPPAQSHAAQSPAAPEPRRAAAPQPPPKLAPRPASRPAPSQESPLATPPPATPVVPETGRSLGSEPVRPGTRKAGAQRPDAQSPGGQGPGGGGAGSRSPRPETPRTLGPTVEETGAERPGPGEAGSEKAGPEEPSPSRGEVQPPGSQRPGSRKPGAERPEAGAGRSLGDWPDPRISSTPESGAEGAGSTRDAEDGDRTAPRKPSTWAPSPQSFSHEAGQDPEQDFEQGSAAPGTTPEEQDTPRPGVQAPGVGASDAEGTPSPSPWASARHTPAERQPAPEPMRRPAQGPPQRPAQRPPHRPGTRMPYANEPAAPPARGLLPGDFDAEASWEPAAVDEREPARRPSPGDMWALPTAPQRPRVTLSDVLSRPTTRILLVTVPALVVIAVVALWLGMREAQNTSGNRPQGAAPASGDAPSAGSSRTPSGKASSSPSSAKPSASTSPDSAALPKDWRWHKDPSGFSIGLPKGWKVSRRQGTRVWFRGANDAFLLIDQTTTPKSDAKKDWQDQERYGKYNFPGYKKVRIASVDYFKTAADWEWTYNSAGGRAHVINRGFVTSKHHGYAIYWEAQDKRWKKDLHYFETFTATFKPAK